MASDRNRNELIIWPEYFDSNLTRKEGRRVAKDIAVPSPTSEDIFKASRKVGLHPELEQDSSYPPRWFNKKGRVKVRKEHSKTEILKMIAQRLKK